MREEVILMFQNNWSIKINIGSEYSYSVWLGSGRGFKYMADAMEHLTERLGEKPILQAIKTITVKETFVNQKIKSDD